MGLFNPKHLKLLVPTAMTVVNEVRAWQARQQERSGAAPRSAATTEQLLASLREQLDHMTDAQLEQAQFVERCAEQIERLSAATEVLAGRVRVLTVALVMTGVVAAVALGLGLYTLS